jgi:hypothetical protein
MVGTSKEQVLFVGVLSLATAGLSFGIKNLMAKWPTEFGPWGALFFLVLGVVLVGQYTSAYVTDDGDEAAKGAD